MAGEYLPNSQNLVRGKKFIPEKTRVKNPPIRELQEEISGKRRRKREKMERGRKRGGGDGDGREKTGKRRCTLKKTEKK